MGMEINGSSIILDYNIRWLNALVFTDGTPSDKIKEIHLRVWPDVVMVF
jgi:hypothetical protein